MNRNKLKNIVLEEYQKIKRDLQEQVPYLGMTTPADTTEFDPGNTTYKGVSSGNEVSIETLKTYYEQDVPVNKRSNFSFNDYLDNMIKDNIITKQTTATTVNQIGMPNETDKTAIALAAGASGFLASGGIGGTTEKLIDAAIYGGTYARVKLQGIKDQKTMKMVSDNLQNLLQSLNQYDKWNDLEYFALRDSQVYSMKKSAVRTRTGGLETNAINRKNFTNILKYAIMSDKALDQVGFSDKTLKGGIFGILDSEFESTDLDKYVLYFLNNGMAQISVSDSAVEPLDGTGYKIALTQSPIELPDKVNGITQYQI